MHLAGASVSYGHISSFFKKIFQNLKSTLINRHLQNSTLGQGIRSHSQLMTSKTKLYVQALAILPKSIN